VISSLSFLSLIFLITVLFVRGAKVRVSVISPNLSDFFEELFEVSFLLLQLTHYSLYKSKKPFNTS
jgi:hypothetical protein